MNTVKTIDINAREWFDKVNGNSYFSAIVTVNYQLENEESFVLPFQYGYGDQYRYEAINELKKRNFITPDNSPYTLKEKGIILRANIQRNCLKRDMYK